MADRPIIFSAPMVRALLDGRKTQTRRVLKVQPNKSAEFSHMEDREARFWEDGLGYGRTLPYAPGDLLWVREAWRTSPAYDDLKPSDLSSDESIRYELDGAWESWGWGDLGCIDGGRYRHSRFMPRWASRLTLTVMDVRVQRLQELSDDDAYAEGACRWGIDNDKGSIHYTVRDDFARLWNSLHGPGAWDVNPWVCAISFTVHRCNIDYMAEAAP